MMVGAVDDVSTQAPVAPPQDRGGGGQYAHTAYTRCWKCDKAIKRADIDKSYASIYRVVHTTDKNQRKFDSLQVGGCVYLCRAKSCNPIRTRQSNKTVAAPHPPAVITTAAILFSIVSAVPDPYADQGEDSDGDGEVEAALRADAAAAAAADTPPTKRRKVRSGPELGGRYKSNMSVEPAAVRMEYARPLTAVSTKPGQRVAASKLHEPGSRPSSAPKRYNEDFMCSLLANQRCTKELGCLGTMDDIVCRDLSGGAAEYKASCSSCGQVHVFNTMGDLAKISVPAPFANVFEVQDVAAFALSQGKISMDRSKHAAEGVRKELLTPAPVYKRFYEMTLPVMQRVAGKVMTKVREMVKKMGGKVFAGDGNWLTVGWESTHGRYKLVDLHTGGMVASETMSRNTTAKETDKLGLSKFAFKSGEMEVAGCQSCFEAYLGAGWDPAGCIFVGDFDSRAGAKGQETANKLISDRDCCDKAEGTECECDPAEPLRCVNCSSHNHKVWPPPPPPAPWTTQQPSARSVLMPTVHSLGRALARRVGTSRSGLGNGPGRSSTSGRKTRADARRS